MGHCKKKLPVLEIDLHSGHRAGGWWAMSGRCMGDEQAILVNSVSI